MFSFGKKKSPLTPDNVMTALAKVQEPFVGKDLVTLNRVKEVAVDGDKVSLTVLLTAPSVSLKKQIEQALLTLGAKKVNLKIELTIPADQRLMAGMHIGVK